MKFFQKKVLGASLVELLVGAGIFVMLMTISASTGIMMYKGKAKIQYTNTLYSETRFLMERMINDVRINTIDYGEYFSQNLQNTEEGEYSLKHNLSSTPGKYGENPGLYEMFFYYIPASDTENKNNVSSNDFSWRQEDRDADVSIGIFNTGADSDTSNDVPGEFTLPQNTFLYEISGTDPVMGLFLISGDGKTKTIYRYRTENSGTRGIIEMAKMKLVDTDSDTTDDIVKNEWTDFYTSYTAGNTVENAQFISVTPPSLSVTKFSFTLAPLDDPQKAFAKPINNQGQTVQIQPHVILNISAQLIDEKARGILGQNTEFSLQSAAASRIFHNVTFPRQ